jgi:hypothetical protein
VGAKTPINIGLLSSNFVRKTKNTLNPKRLEFDHPSSLEAIGSNKGQEEVARKVSILFLRSRHCRRPHTLTPEANRAALPLLNSIAALYRLRLA